MDFFKEDWCSFNGINEVDSPALIIYKDRVVHNILQIKTMINDVNRLRPHVKTHKTTEVTNLLIGEGINRFKCATIAEAEMLGMCGAKDVLLAYQPTKVKLIRFINLIKKYQATSFSCLVDNKATANFISEAARTNNISLSVYMDLNVGMDRTGIKPEAAYDLYYDIKTLKGVNLIGFHAYDGHIYEKDLVKRKAKWSNAFKATDELIAKLRLEGNDIALVAGGIPTFPFHSQKDKRECSPGTFVFWDKGYGDDYEEQKFLPAAIILCRVVSIVSENKVCIDLGYKSIASENLLNRRVHFLNHPEAKPISHSEEHMVIEKPIDSNLKIGDLLYALPGHICPTIALYEKAIVVDQGSFVESWKIVARNRSVSV
ncbi:D-TA family PLP-dependent enzyme [Pedobacter sp. ASV1-7]|uniref:D-TA family PLP-dependent enzyme n=1 Tax=Pedobacter sp. ASV1-7 TaxID=3145237 RepID=UPI0032E85A91